MNFEFEVSLTTEGFSGALFLPEHIAEQLRNEKIKRVIVDLKYAGRELQLHAGVLKRKGVTYLMLSKQKQKHLKVQHADKLSVQLRPDTTKYQAPMTEELEAVLLSDYEAYEIFENLLPGKQRNIIFMIYNTKGSQKRVDVALNVMENLKMGNLNPMKFEKLL